MLVFSALLMTPSIGARSFQLQKGRTPTATNLYEVIAQRDNQNQGAIPRGTTRHRTPSAGTPTYS